MQERSPRLDAKVAIVTGAGSSGPGVGTGKAIAVLFAREGCRVLLADAVTARAEETLATICAKGGEAFVEQVDVTRSDDCRRMVDAAVDRYGRLDILVNNVGIIAPGNVVDVDEADWDRVMDTNLKSMMMTSKHAIPRMIDGGGGAIVNLSSFMGLRAGYETEPVAYSASKGGVIALTTAMASEHGRDNVRVNAIAPGYLYTPMVAGNLTEELRELRRKSAPLGTEGTAWDVAWAAVYLASDEARWVTGVTLPVDAGILATSPLASFRHMT